MNLQQWIEHPEVLNRETLYELRTLMVRYPYFQSLRLLYLKNLYILHDGNYGAELRKNIFFIADRKVLFQQIEGENYHLRKEKLTLEGMGKEQDQPSTDRTLSLIDAFLEEIPDDGGGQLTLDYSTDYTAYLLNESTTGDDQLREVPKLYGQDLIDGFIEKSEKTSANLLVADPEETNVDQLFLIDTESTLEEDDSDSVEIEEDDSCFTETLAKIYIKQQRYSKALEIIKKLSLKYPKKNAYFADQMRFLEKLIINAKSK